MDLKQRWITLIHERISSLPAWIFQGLIPWLSTPFVVLMIVYLSATLASARSLPIEPVDTQSKLLADYGPWRYTEINLVRPEIVDEARLDQKRQEASPTSENWPATLTNTPGVTAPQPTAPPHSTQPPDVQSTNPPPPTATHQPSTPPPSETPPSKTPPPTHTSAPEALASCSDLIVTDEEASASGLAVMMVTSTTGQVAQLQRVELSWNLQDEREVYLRQIEAQGTYLFNGQTQDSPMIIDSTSLTVVSGQPLLLRFRFSLGRSSFNGTIEADLTFNLEGVGTCELSGTMNP